MHLAFSPRSIGQPVVLYSQINDCSDMKYNYKFQGYSISQMRSIHSTTSNTLIIYNCMAYGQLIPIEHMACPFLTLTSPSRSKYFVMHELDLMHAL